MTSKDSALNRVAEMKAERAGLRMRICGLESDLEAAQKKIDELEALLVHYRRAHAGEV